MGITIQVGKLVIRVTTNLGSSKAVATSNFVLSENRYTNEWHILSTCTHRKGTELSVLRAILDYEELLPYFTND